MPSFALAIPHTPWIPARAESMNRLLTQLRPIPHTCSWTTFTERCANWIWSKDLWEWAENQDATHLLQLQDDVIVAPNFWPSLRAMVSAQPNAVIGLQGAHPKLKILARDGYRWARSRAWMVGVGYVIPKGSLPDLLAFRESLPSELVQKTNEDDLIAGWCVRTGRDVLHPIPTIIDHDTTIESTYGNGHHAFRRPTVTWRDFGEKEIESPEFWSCPEDVPTVSNPHLKRCWFCEQEPEKVAFSETGASIGARCLVAGIAGGMGVRLNDE